MNWWRAEDQRTWKVPCVSWLCFCVLCILLYIQNLTDMFVLSILIHFTHCEKPCCCSSWFVFKPKHVQELPWKGFTLRQDFFAKMWLHWQFCYVFITCDMTKCFLYSFAILYPQWKPCLLELCFPSPTSFWDHFVLPLIVFYIYSFYVYIDCIVYICIS